MVYFGYFVLGFLLIQTSKSELSSLLVIHRHADRTPVVTYPEDPYSCHWTQGFGTLIDKGIHRMQEFGRIFRKVYGDFWPHKSDVEVQSSRVDRVIKSVESLLDGVYNDDFLENPIRIQSKQFKDDKMLFPITTNCPEYNAELDRVHNLPENQEWLNKNKPLWDYLAEKSGEDLHKLDVRDRLHIVNLQDTFLVQRQFNLTLPAWMNDQVYDKLAEAAIKQMKIIYSTKKLQRLPAGLLFKEIRDHMNAVRIGWSYKKVRLFSTHDVKLAAMLMGLNAFNERLPPYGTSIIFEFHSTGFLMFRKTVLKAYYLNDTSTGTLHPLRLGDCDVNLGCPFEKVNELIKDLIPEDWDKECGNTK